MARQKVALHHLHEKQGPAVRQYLDALVEVLPNAEAHGPDETGFIELELDAEDRDDALRKVIDGIAATGADDHLEIAEHPG
jgi:hypothetical protein